MESRTPRTSHKPPVTTNDHRSSNYRQLARHRSDGGFRAAFRGSTRATPPGRSQSERDIRGRRGATERQSGPALGLVGGGCGQPGRVLLPVPRRSCSTGSAGFTGARRQLVRSRVSGQRTAPRTQPYTKRSPALGVGVPLPLTARCATSLPSATGRPLKRTQKAKGSHPGTTRRAVDPCGKEIRCTARHPSRPSRRHQEALLRPDKLKRLASDRLARTDRPLTSGQPAAPQPVTSNADGRLRRGQRSQGPRG